MKLSPFLSKVIISNDTLALFHSLNMEVLYIREDTATLTDEKLIALLAEIDHQDFLVPDDFQEAQYLGELTDRLNTNVFTFTTLKMFTTTACNLNCKYCLIKKNIEKRDVPAEFLSYEKAEEILEFFCNVVAQGRESHRTLMLYGGEPLLNWSNVQKIISKARDLEQAGMFNGDLEIVLETNGMLVTQEIADFLKDHAVFIIVSLDGTEAIHDHYRITCDGDVSWQRATAGYNMLKETGCIVVISSVFTDGFALNSEAAIINLIDQFSPYSIGLNLYHVLDGQHIEDDNTLNRVHKYVESWQLAREKGLYIEHIMRRIRPLVEKKIRLKDCGACGNRIVSDCQGNLGICEGFVGNEQFFTRREDICDIVLDQIFIDWAERTQLLMAECLGCIAQGVCGGGCAYNGIILNGDLMKPDPYICSASKELVLWAIHSWYAETEIADRLKETRMSWLTDNERPQILGKTPLHPPIPLQSISKEREHKT